MGTHKVQVRRVYDDPARGDGNRVLVVEKASSLGGTPTHALVTPMMDSRVPHGHNLREIERRLNALENRLDRLEGGHLRCVLFGVVIRFSGRQNQCFQCHAIIGGQVRTQEIECCGMPAGMNDAQIGQVEK